MNRFFLAAVAVVVLAAVPALRADELDDLARDFWAWRASEMPVSTDDIPRLERPTNWVPDWSPQAVARYRREREQFEARWKKIDASTWPVSRQVDYRLIGSAIARVRWELEFTRNWQRNAMFYSDQTLGAYFNLLLQPPPFDRVRSQWIVKSLASIPATLEGAKQNLTRAVAPFTRLALAQLQNVRAPLTKSVHELKPLLDPAAAREIDAASENAMVALENYRDWLNQRLPATSSETAVGREAYVFFLKKVALLPYTPEQLLAMGRQEWARSVACQTYEEHRNLGLPELIMFKSGAEQIARETKDELAIRRYLEEKDILSVPPWVQHYENRVTPGYLQALAGLHLGELDDFTSASRLKENGVRYIEQPDPTLGYFASSSAKDPRPLIVHEGIPGHYFQLVLAWASPDQIRRQYYDSGANEGIAFYAEEMLMEAGLFDDSPRTREIICNFMRLRALRVEVDVKLALGDFTMDQAAEYLIKTVPMDPQTAHQEASFFAVGPGQAISYQIGKLQIVQMLAEARRKQGDAFRLQAFHDFVWRNGNVPISLQRWEYLGLKDEIEILDRN